MEKEYIPYEQALQLRELGFDYPTIVYWTEGINGYNIVIGDYHNYTNNHWMFTADDGKNRDKMCVAPLYQQAFRWFRENHYYNCFVTSTKDKKWCYFREDLLNRKNDSEPELTPKYDTYEEAELACLKKLIEIVKNK